MRHGRRCRRPRDRCGQIIRKNCTACHGIDDYAFFALDRAGWEKLIETKHKNGEVRIADNDRVAASRLDRQQIRSGDQTLSREPTLLRRSRRSSPTAKPNDFSIGPARSCHEIERINQSRRTEEGWRVLAVDMRERGAQLSDEELERLVEWLGRVKGTNQSQ